MMRSLLIIGLGGGVGSVLRWLVVQWAGKYLSIQFPWGTFIVNFFGCLLIGAIVQITDRADVSDQWRLLLATGFCGGFTTFSAFALENFKLIESGNYQGFVLYTFGSIAAGLVGVLAGFKILG